ncbi:hypothetical protein [uncultured Rubinisphaera sp.]|uniref:hypothetical protein n=1 Tax=uncultured Rubinisphaera sp. TaxID=1678686 RepID=UPI0030D6EA9C|tara:strand:+ start:3366 stop:3767 length:402 start_codon:yes stop_codon:yes gene_type:complete
MNSTTEIENQNLPEEEDPLWLIFMPPLTWAVHFMACYLTAAIWCAKFSDTSAHFATVRIAIAIYTAVALAIIGGIGGYGFLQHRHITGKTPHDDDTPLDRHRFLGFATFLLALLSAIATIFVATVAVIFGSCE